MKYRTTDLMNELNSTSGVRGFDDFIKAHKDLSEYNNLCEFFNDYFRTHPDIDVSLAIKHSNLDRGYAYQILNGRKEHPGKYKLVILCMCIGMNLKDIQRALTISGNAVLYPKIPQDAALIVCINNGYDSMLQINEFMSSSNIDLNI